MQEMIDAAIEALRNPRTQESDTRLWQEIVKRGLVYMSEKQMQQVRYLIPRTHESRKPA